MRTSRGLPFNACVNARVCNSTAGNPAFLGKPAHLIRDHELYHGVAPPGLTHLTYRWRERASEAHAKNVAMHLCVCLITLIRPLIICNLSNQSLYRVLSLLALLQGSFTETRDEHTCSLYLIH